MKNLPSLLARLARIERDAGDPDAADSGQPFNPARKLRALRDLHAWIASGFIHLPPEPHPPADGALPSRVAAMCEAADDVLASAVCGPLIEAGLEPANLSLDELRVSWCRLAHHYVSELSDPIFGVADDDLDELARRQRERRRPADLPPAWAKLADSAAFLGGITKPYVGTPPPAPDPSFA